MSSDCLFDGLLSYGLVVVWFYSLVYERLLFVFDVF